MTTRGPVNISRDVIEALKGALTDATLVDDERGFRVCTVGAPHVTGCATAHEPGEGETTATSPGAHSSKASACSFALDVKGALRAVPCSSSDAAAAEGEIDGAFHVARIVSDAEFEGGIGPLNVEVALDGEKEEGDKAAAVPSSAAPSSSPSSAEAAIERARAEIARRIVGAVSSVVKASESPRKGGKEEKEEKNEEVKVGGEAA